MEKSDLLILEKKIEFIEDKELLRLIKMLIEERNYLVEIANIDSLTGVQNRRLLNRIRYCNAIVMCDVDDFKVINDKYGHSNGDKVIRSIALTIQHSIREKDYLCRYGGDEFFIGFTDCPNEIILERLELIRDIINNSTVLSDDSNNITMSFGVAFNEGTFNLDNLLIQADKALYKSKEDGKNKISIFNDKYEYVKKK